MKTIRYFLKFVLCFAFFFAAGQKKPDNTDESKQTSQQDTVVTTEATKTASSEENVLKISFDFEKFKRESIFVAGGKKKVTIINLPATIELQIDISVSGKKYKALTLPIEERKNLPANTFTYEIQEAFDFDKYTKVEIKIFKVNQGSKSKIAVYRLNGDTGKNWFTSFGVNSAFLTHSDTYKTTMVADAFRIEQDGGQKIIEYVPSIMFTFMNTGQPTAYGFTGGLGFDLEKISAFFGFSVGIGQNLFLTGGVTFHQQERLDSKYSSGQMVDATLSFDDLHSEYYRFNPFIGMSIRLDKNPFK